MASKVGVAKFGALGFLVLGLGCAAFATFLVGDAMRGKYTGTRVAPVVVANTELRAGMPVSAGALEVRQWPEDAVPRGAFATVDSLIAAHDGTIVTVGILPGEPVVASRLGTSLNGTGVAPLVRPNMRAIALKVDDALGFTGLVYPGAYVDVIATVRDPMGAGSTSRTAVQRVRVLSVGMDADVATRRNTEQKVDRLTSTAASSGTYITLELSPGDAEVVSLARNTGVIDIVLRNATDDQTVDSSGAGPDEFTAKAPLVAELDSKPAPAREPKIQIVANDGPDVPAKPRRSRASSNDRTEPTEPTLNPIETYRAK
jgi:pilus assembly protein CpaB